MQKNELRKVSRRITAWLAIGAVLGWSIGSYCFCALGVSDCCGPSPLVSDQGARGSDCCARSEEPADTTGDDRQVGRTSQSTPAEVCSCSTSTPTATPAIEHFLLLPSGVAHLGSESDTRLETESPASCFTPRITLTPPARAPPCATGLS